MTAQRLACGPDWCQLSGNDETALAFVAMVPQGCISGHRQALRRALFRLPECDPFEGRWDDALALQDRLYPLHDALFYRLFAGSGQICAVAHPQRHGGGGSAANDMAVQCFPHDG